ncbi:MAG: nucleotide exchange factor GrpE [Bacteroidales bacterium]|jgi:molecular chaperone GrpE|nr:nucleotide exchange factor GrpE [Bacteroidales bacterium]
MADSAGLARFLLHFSRKNKKFMNETTHPDQEETPLTDISETPEITDESEKADPIDQLATDLKEAQDKYLRLYSDFENFRKRSQKERLDLIKSASETVILSLLPILDDFDRALPSISDETTKSGIELIYTKLKTTLELQGLKVMETKGIAFDADLHEAIAQTPTNNKAEKGLIIDEVQRGYYLNDKVIRHAKVIVGN